MARVTGPLHSDTASGTLGGSMVFSAWKGRAYVRTHVMPANPKTAKQQGVRALFKFLAKAWATIGSTPKATWDALGTSKQISAYNAYISKGQSDWQEGIAPQKSLNAARASTPIAVTTQTLTGGSNQVTIAVTPAGATNIWAIAIYRGVTGMAATWADCIAVLPANGTTPITFVDTPLEAGTYFYRTQILNDDGVMGTAHAEASATAT